MIISSINTFSRRKLLTFRTIGIWRNENHFENISMEIKARVKKASARIDYASSQQRYTKRPPSFCLPVHSSAEVMIMAPAAPLLF